MKLLNKSFAAALGLACLLTMGSTMAAAQFPWQTQDDSAPGFRDQEQSPSPAGQPPGAGPFGGGASPLGPGAALPGSGRPAMGFAPPSPEEIQRQMEEDTKRQQGRLREMAFDQALEALMPLTPEEIRRMLDVFMVNREAAEQPVAIPTPRTFVGNVSLDPSAEPLVVQTSPGYVTTLNIVDMTGAPWPIQDISWAGEFEIVPPEEGGNILRITPMTAHGRGNMSIRLAELRTPITLTLTTQLEIVHYRFEARLPRSGPLAEVPLVERGGIDAVARADDLIQYMDGYVPGHAASLHVKGVDGRTRAWRTGDGNMILRTPMTLISPGWDSSISSGDGTRIYSLRETPVVLLSEKGRMVQAHLSTGAFADE